jgi:septal ring factor EnvC (AmiA/AmiB activator)
MKRIDVEVGQFVLAREPIAVMGKSESEGGSGSGQNRPVLYIEFRKDSRPINPAPWWVKAPEKVQG